MEDWLVRLPVGQRHLGHRTGGDEAGQPDRIVQHRGGRIVDRLDREGAEMVGEPRPPAGADAVAGLEVAALLDERPP